MGDMLRTTSGAEVEHFWSRPCASRAAHVSGAEATQSMEVLGDSP